MSIPPAPPRGREVRPAGYPGPHRGPTIHGVDPSTGLSYGPARLADLTDVESAVAAARAATGTLERLTISDRIGLLESLADAVERNADAYADAESLETGKTLGNAERSVAVALEGLRVDSGSIPTATPSEDWRGVGTVACVLPSNAAIFTAGIKAGAAIAAGCAIICKPPPEAALAVTMLAEDALEAGMPPGALISLPGGADIAAALMDADLGFISFTGSRQVGLQVAAHAGSRGVPVGLELGGGAPVLVLEGADPVASVGGLIWAAFGNAGQVCVAANVIRVHESLYDEFLERYVAAARDLRIGPAYEPDTQVGPLHTAARLAAVHRAVQDLDQVVTGGERPQGDLPDGGHYFAPTVVAGEPVSTDEIFGPVVFISSYSDLDAAVDLTNRTMTGLAAGVWGPDNEVATVSRRLATGQVYLNRHYNPSPGRLPAEPWGISGFGRADPVDFLRRRRFYG